MVIFMDISNTIEEQVILLNKKISPFKISHYFGEKRKEVILHVETEENVMNEFYFDKLDKAYNFLAGYLNGVDLGKQL